MSKTVKWRKSIPVSIQHRNNPFVGFKQDFENIFNEFNQWLSTTQLPMDQFENLNISPSIDILDTKTSFKVEVEMPGMGEEDIKVDVNNNVLTIKGEKSTSKKDSGNGYVMREISYGNYERSITLPESVDSSKGDASFKKGMLWITFPKKPSSTPVKKEITVKKAQ
jgi:HSP20 family protein